MSEEISLIERLRVAVEVLEEHVQYDDGDGEPSGEAQAMEAVRDAIVALKDQAFLRGVEGELLEWADKNNVVLKSPIFHQKLRKALRNVGVTV
jgi:hypothetical protein